MRLKNEYFSQKGEFCHYLVLKDRCSFVLYGNNIISYGFGASVFTVSSIEMLFYGFILVILLFLSF